MMAGRTKQQISDLQFAVDMLARRLNALEEQGTTVGKTFDRYGAERAEAALSRVRALLADSGDFRLCPGCSAEVAQVLDGGAR
jgi:hypothetical protein